MRSMKKSRAEQSSNLRYFDLVQPSPFYTPQYHKPVSHQGRHTPHRHSVLNTIATPSRNTSRLPKGYQASSSLEKAKAGVKQASAGAPKKTPDKENLLGHGKSQKDVDMLINSLLSDDDDSGNDVIDNNDDVIVIDDEEAVVSTSDRISPMASPPSKAAVSNIYPTPPTVYTKFQPQSSNIKEERRASAAAVVELFNDDSSEDDNDDPMQREDPLIRPTPDVITQTRKDPLTGVAPKIMRRGHVMKEPLIRVSPMLVRNRESATAKRKLKNDQMNTKGGMRIEECVTDNPAIRANLMERNKEVVMEDPLAVISPKRSKLRSSQRKPPVDCGETPGLIGSEEPVLEDPLIRLSPPMEKRKLRSSRKRILSTHEAAPRMIKETIIDGESSHQIMEFREKEPAKRRLRSSHRAPPATSEDGGVAPGLIEESRKEEELVEDQLDGGSSELTVELGEKPITEKRKTRKSSRREPPATFEDGGVATGLMKKTRKEKNNTGTKKRMLRSRNPAPVEENVLLAENQMGSDRQTVTVSSSRITRSRQAQERNSDKLSTIIEAKRTTRRSTRTATARSTRSSENDKSYMHDSLDGLSSESEWNTTDDEDDDLSSGEEMEVEVTNKRRAPLKPINTIKSKSRKRSSPTPPRSAAIGYTNKRLKLSLSSKRTEKAKKLKKVRTVEKKRVSTPATVRGNGETATLLSSRRKILTPHIPQRKKVTFGKSSTAGSKTNQFEAAKER